LAKTIDFLLDFLLEIVKLLTMSDKEEQTTSGEGNRFTPDPVTNILTAKPVKSVAEFINLVGSCRHDARIQSRDQLLPILFRGQYHDFHGLIPRIGRSDADFIYSRKFEQHLLREFKRRSSIYMVGSNQQLTALEALALGQHNGLITRLLDWTDSGLAALWFATKEWITDKNLPAELVGNTPGKETAGITPPEEPADREQSNRPAKPTKNAVVWIFFPDEKDLYDPTKDRVGPEDDEKLFHLPTTMVISPRHFAERIRAQSGWFTLHANGEEEQTFPALDIDGTKKPNLRRIPIEFGAFREILRDLKQNGVNAASIYPDLPYLAEYLNYSVGPKALDIGSVFPTFLSDISPQSVHLWSKVLQPDDPQGLRNQFTVGGTASPHGLYTHPIEKDCASVCYSLAKRFSRLTGKAAIADGDAKCATPLDFHIIVNGTVKWSKTIQENGKPEPFDVDVAGVNKLELKVDCKRQNYNAWACWFEPMLQ